MEKNKPWSYKEKYYYIPDIEEFYVGFEYEHKYTKWDHGKPYLSEWTSTEHVYYEGEYPDYDCTQNVKCGS